MPACEEIPMGDVIPEWDDRNDILAASNVALSEYARYLQERQSGMGANPKRLIES